jgi:hypothetical protein
VLAGSVAFTFAFVTTIIPVSMASGSSNATTSGAYDLHHNYCDSANNNDNSADWNCADDNTGVEWCRVSNAQQTTVGRPQLFGHGLFHATGCAGVIDTGNND